MQSALGCFEFNFILVGISHRQLGAFRFNVIVVGFFNFFDLTVTITKLKYVAIHQVNLFISYSTQILL